MAVFPSNLTWVGLARETVPGTAEAAPTIWVPVLDPKWTPVQTMLKDDAMRGSMAATFQQVQGVRHDTIDYKAYFYLDSLVTHVRNLLGGVDTVTGSADPWSHAFSLKNTGDAQPPSYTLFLYNGSECWQMAASQLVQGEFDIPAEGAPTGSYQWMGMPAVKLGSVPTNTPTTLRPWAGWNTTVTLGGLAAPVYSSVKITVKRETQPIHTADGTQAPYAIFVGPITVTGELTGVYQGHTGAPLDLQNYLVNTQPVLLVQVNPVGDATHYARWQMSVVAYDEASINGAAGKYLEIEAKWEALANSTDAVGGGQSPMRFILANTSSTPL